MIKDSKNVILEVRFRGWGEQKVKIMKCEVKIMITKFYLSAFI
jgi:hypothetical protein